MSAVIVAIIASSLLFEACCVGVGLLMGYRGVELAKGVGAMHAIYVIAGVLIAALSLLWMWALP